MAADVIWKFDVPMPDGDGRSIFDLPLDSEILSAGLQADGMVVWARIGAPFEGRRDTRSHRLIVVNTGHEIPAFTGRFLNTLTAPNGTIWHVFDGGRYA